jgi:predicted DNA-binding transcriptional regulator YafY
MELMAAESDRQITFRYRNWRGETSTRTAVPVEIWFGKSEWHPEDQWFLKAVDVQKGDVRDFAFVDMSFGPNL